MGGPDNEMNLAPMFRGLNRIIKPDAGVWGEMEKYIRTCLEQGGSSAEGRMEVRLKYDDTKAFYRYIPTKFEGSFRISGCSGTKLYAFDFNNTPGVAKKDFGPCPGRS